MKIWHYVALALAGVGGFWLYKRNQISKREAIDAAKAQAKAQAKAKADKKKDKSVPAQVAEVMPGVVSTIKDIVGLVGKA